MGTAVYDIHHWNRQISGIDPSQIPVKRHVISHGGGPCGGHGYAEHGIRTQFGFVGRAVQFYHSVVQSDLVSGIHPGDGRRNHVGHIFYGPGHTFAAKTLGTFISEFKGFTFSG